MTVPKLRFSGFNDAWTSKQLKEITSYVDYRGKTPVKSDKGVFLVTAKNVRQGYIDYAASQEFIPIDDYEDVMRRGKPIIGDVLITTEAPLGYVASVDREDIALAQRVIKLRGVQGIIHNDFLKFNLASDRFQKELFEKASGGTVKGIKGSVLHKMNVQFPNLLEQTKIANFLTAVDEKITQLTQKSDLLAQYKKGVMQKIFSQELRFKDDDGQEFPAWEEVALSKLGKSFNGLTGKAGDDFGEGKPYITYKQIFDDSKIDVNKFSYVQIAENENQNQVKYGDVFFTTSSETPEEVGYCSVLLSDVNDVYLNSFCFGYRINSFDKLHPNFARFIFKSPDFRRDVIKLAQGSTRYNISKTNFMEISIKLPFIDEQMKIASFLTAIDDKITQTQAELDAVKQYKQGLLQQMFV